MSGFSGRPSGVAKGWRFKNAAKSESWSWGPFHHNYSHSHPRRNRRAIRWSAKSQIGVLGDLQQQWQIYFPSLIGWYLHYDTFMTGNDRSGDYHLFMIFRKSSHNRRNLAAFKDHRGRREYPSQYPSAPGNQWVKVDNIHSVEPLDRVKVWPF